MIFNFQITNFSFIIILLIRRFKMFVTKKVTRYKLKDL